MCILSLFWENNENWVLTHNRDERIYRKFEEGFTKRMVYGAEIYSPFDSLAGGTWIFYSDRFVACVLNGGFVPHIPNRTNKISRGKLILEILKFKSVEEFISEQILYFVEPFTFVIIDLQLNKRYRLVWDGMKKHLEEIEKPFFVWSSSTLYGNYRQKEIKEHFYGLKSTSKQNLLEMHKNLRIVEHPFVEELKTTSISQISSLNKNFDSIFINTSFGS